MILTAIDSYISGKCQREFEFYCEYSLSLPSSIGDKQPFKLFDYQAYVSRLLDKKNKMVVVTPRQMGFSRLAAARCFWEIQSKPNTNVLVVVTSQWEVKQFMSIIVEWISSGAYFQTQAPKGQWSSKLGEIVCIANNSTLKCISSSALSSVRGTSIDLLVMLDFAYHDSAHEAFGNLFPSLTSNSKVLVVSTPADISNSSSGKAFKDLFVDAQKGKNGFYPYRVPWWARPGNSIKQFADLVGTFGITRYDQEILASFD